MRDIDWLMFADHLPSFTYSMSVWLANPYEEKHLRFIADNDYDAANKAVDTLAYYIANRWYFANRPIEYFYHGVCTFQCQERSVSFNQPSLLRRYQLP